VADLHVAEVAIPLPLDGSFHYLVPDQLRGRLEAGHAVAVPFGGRRLTGYVLELTDEIPEGRELRPISALELDEPLFDPSLTPLFRWIARYYAHPLGEVVRTALPGSTRTATRSVVRLLPGGAQPSLLHDADITRLLERLAASPVKALSLNAVRKRVGISQAALRRAARDGLVEIVQEEGKAVTRTQTEEFFSLAGDVSSAKDAFARPGPVRDRMIEYLSRFGPVSKEALKEAFPTLDAPLRALRKAGVLAIEERQVDPEAAEQVAISEEDRVPPPPTEAQSAALEALLPALEKHTFHPCLLHGVTGSGKTEVYLQLADRVLAEGGGAVLLVPEIGLTPQFLARFRARFGRDVVAVLHSSLTPRERFDEWTRIRRGQARLAIGPRSAVFAPVHDLRLVVVDEEHDGSYKQEEGLRYNARDVALVRARQAGAVCLLGSATPALESVWAASEGRYQLLRLPARVLGRPMPGVELVDLREHPVDDPDSPAAALSPPLRDALQENHDAGGQAILLLNRRGFATTVICTACGVHFRCEECDVSLTYHVRRHQLLCHWCGAFRHLPDVCPDCADPQGLKAVGRGTERLEEEMLALWPEIRIDRMDADTTRSRAGHRRILDRFRRGDVDVLVGTQMVAKGHDFPRVTLVGVLHADAALHLPDFRASERTYQLISQVAGRAGRGDRPGRVLVQTWHPDHHAIRLALEHDFGAFARRELRFRRGLRYPPFSRLTLFRISAGDQRDAVEAAHLVRARLDEAASAIGADRDAVQVQGPSPSPMYRIKGRYRWQVMLKAADHNVTGRLLHALPTGALRDEIKAARGEPRLIIDRDPVSLL
jgi:primosomal protein N' (replication factor Y) (superfamily II helicase)